MCATLGLASGACHARSDRYAAMDVPPPPVVPLGEAAPANPDPGSNGGPGGTDPDCGPRTGRTPAGSCVTLRTYDAGYVERVQMPSGTFVMGDVPPRYSASESLALEWAWQPPRHVQVASFFIDLHEVTIEAYRACVAEGLCSAARCPDGRLAEEHPELAKLSAELRGAFPQTCVRWADADAFCRARGGRLPTEAEWEYAARGPDARIYPMGKEIPDDLPASLVPVGQMAFDRSYFGILGFAMNGAEWVAEARRDDAGLAPFLARPFRSPQGPAARARAAFEQKIACPGAVAGAPGKSRCEPVAANWRLTKSMRPGIHRAVRTDPPAGFTGPELDGETIVGSDLRLGFRCAADLRPGDEPLVVPADPAPVPTSFIDGELELFGGVAESVDFDEARAFCKYLRLPGEGEGARPFRLPTLAEIQAHAEVFRGPGPFWALEGAVVQEGGASAKSDAPWVSHPAEPDAGLLARCVRASHG